MNVNAMALSIVMLLTAAVLAAPGSALGQEPIDPMDQRVSEPIGERDNELLRERIDQPMAGQADEPIGEQATERYGGFAEDNPALIDDRGRRLQQPGDQIVDDRRAVGDTTGSEVYPQEIEEGNEPLTPSLEDQPPPYAGETDIYSGFGENNSDLLR